MAEPALPGRGRLVVLAVALALLLALLGWRLWGPSDGSADGERQGSGPVAGDTPGADALRGADWSTVREDPDAAFTRSGDYVPDTAQGADDDQPEYYADGCHLEREETTITGCTYGDEEGSVDVAVLGSSKAGVWMPVLDQIGRREGWRVTVYTKSSCAFDPPAETSTYPECTDYNTAVQERLLADPPDIVVTSGQVTDSRELEPADLSATWRDLLDAGTEHVVAVWEIPMPSRHVGECLATLRAGERTDYVKECSYGHTDEAGVGILEEAVELTDGAQLLDVRDWVCPASTLSPRCPPVIGGVVVLGLGAHLTDSYARTLTDPVHQELFELGVAGSEPTDP